MNSQAVSNIRGTFMAGRSTAETLAVAASEAKALASKRRVQFEIASAEAAVARSKADIAIEAAVAAALKRSTR
jgi:hypothetical protein